jgi:hypothetical protein
VRERRREEPPASASSETETPADTTAVTQSIDRAGAAPPRRDRGGRLLRAIAIGVLVLAAVCAACSIAMVSAWATATGNGAIVAGVVIALGAVLAVAAFTGEARWRWLIAPALVLALPAGAVAAGDVRFDSGIGERDYRPTSAAQVPSDGYSLGVGHLVVDLRGMPWHRDQLLEVETDMGLGQTVVRVPSDVCVQAQATASAGDVYVRGQRSSGVDADVDENPPQGRAPRLVLDSELEAGQIVVSDRPGDVNNERTDFGPRDFDDLDGSGGEERRQAARTCSR